MSEVKWYCRGEIGEYICDQVDSVYDSIIDRQQFCVRMEQVGLSASEIRDLMMVEGIFYYNCS